MKVKIALTVEVDPQDWDQTYGTGTDAAAIREDVKRWATSAVGGQPEGLVEIVSVAK